MYYNATCKTLTQKSIENFLFIFMIFRIYLHSNPLHFGYPLSLLLI